MSALNDLFNPDDKHEIDPTHIVQDHEAVCTCGAWCVSFEAHLEEVEKHRKEWDEFVKEHGDPVDPMVLMGRRGWPIPPYTKPRQ